MNRAVLYLAVFATVATQFAIISGTQGQRTEAPKREKMKVHPFASAAPRDPIEGELPSLSGATAWLNSQPLTPASLRGKVVLVQFWTYTCINWRRTLPYVRAWAEKYKAQGFVVIGVHTPEFPFEKNLDNIRQQANDMMVDYPIAVDSDYAVWTAFNNQYWPALYLVDGQGRIRYHHFGEGEYEKSERMIQKLLSDNGVRSAAEELVSVDPRGAEVAADWNDLQSPENYVGYGKAEGFVSPGSAARDKERVYAAPGKLGLNEWALSGNWTITRGYAAVKQSNGRIVYRFHARDVNLVMGPATRGKSVRFRVLIDGKPPGGAHGADIDEQGYGTLSEQRLYQLIREHQPIVDRQFEIEFLDPGVEAFAFTFG
jgi:thiol-disulfide isomerase/thioredoxin